MSNKEKNINIIYTAKDYKSDQSKFNKNAKDGKVDWANFSRLMTYDLCTRSSVIENGCIGDINLRDIELALKYPKQGWKILLRKILLWSWMKMWKM